MRRSTGRIVTTHVGSLPLLDGSNNWRSVQISNEPAFGCAIQIETTERPPVARLECELHSQIVYRQLIRRVVSGRRTYGSDAEQRTRDQTRVTKLFGNVQASIGEIDPIRKTRQRP